MAISEVAAMNDGGKCVLNRHLSAIGSCVVNDGGCVLIDHIGACGADGVWGGRGVVSDVF